MTETLQRTWRGWIFGVALPAVALLGLARRECRSGGYELRLVTRPVNGGLTAVGAVPRCVVVDAARDRNHP